MGPLILVLNLSEALSDAERLDPSVASARRKLRLVFEAYALSIGLTDSKLRVRDICTDRADVDHRLCNFVTRKYPATEKYRGQILSRIRKLIKSLTGMTAEQVSADGITIVTRDIPGYMQPIVPLLPRDNLVGERRSPRSVEDRSQALLSKAGLYFLSACLDVHKNFGIDCLEDLLCGHNLDILRSCKKLSGGNSADGFGALAGRIRKAFNLLLPERQLVSLRKEFWPTKLRSQWDMYYEKAARDPSDDEELLATAEEFDFKVNRLKKRTLEVCEEVLQLALGRIVPHALTLGMKNFGIEELLRIKHGVRIRKGVKIPFDFNPLIEVFREHERKRSSTKKRRNHDSRAFEQFISTLKRIGLYTGHAHLVESFNKTYGHRKLDNQTKKERKTLQLAVYSRPWLDAKIDELEHRFYEVIRQGTFKIDPGKRNANDAHADFRFCLFYIALLVLRYFGYRQQCLRCCTVGENIIFNSDGTITFWWPKTLVKNKRNLKAVLDGKKRPYQKKVVNALWAYYRKIYPYVMKLNAANGALGLIENQFFVRFNKQHQYVRFGTDKMGGKEFYNFWTNQSELHLELDKLDVEERPPFNPHFLRAFCINWMKEDLGLSDEDIAEAVGDTVKIVRSEYINKDRIFDATAITDKIAKIYEEREREELNLKEQLKLMEQAHSVETTQLRQAAEEWMNQAKRAEERAINLESELAAVRFTTEGLNTTVQEQSRLISELFEKLNQKGRRKAAQAA